MMHVVSIMPRESLSQLLQTVSPVYDITAQGDLKNYGEVPGLHSRRDLPGSQT